MSGPLLTAILAVFVFAVGQAVLRFVLEPIQEYKKLIGEVAHALLFYANRGPYGFTLEQLEETANDLRGMSGRIRSSIFYVPFYDTIALMGFIPKKSDALEAATQLVGWSNSLKREDSSIDNLKRRRIIADKLGITRRLGKLE